MAGGAGEMSGDCGPSPNKLPEGPGGSFTGRCGCKASGSWLEAFPSLGRRGQETAWQLRPWIVRSQGRRKKERASAETVLEAWVLWGAGRFFDDNHALFVNTYKSRNKQLGNN